jgi:hypothetical protein
MIESINLRKALLFASFGAVGCLCGWAVGEIFLLVFLPATNRAGGSLASKPELRPLATKKSMPAPPLPPPVENVFRNPQAPPPPPPAEFANRLKEAGAQTGDVQITLIWFNVNDLDLHCIDPKGEEIFYAHRRSRSGGELDVDMNAGGPRTNKPVENIYWPKGKAPGGKYKVFVNHYANHGGKDPTDYKVSVLVGNSRKEYAGAISRFQPKRLICQFDVNPAGQDFFLAVSPELVVYRGGTNQLQIRIAHPNLQVKMPIRVRFEGDVRGLDLREFSVTPNQTETTAIIQAEAGAAIGERIVTVSAAAEGAQAETSFLLRVKDIPPTLRLAVPREIQIVQTGENGLPLRIARDRFTGPVKVRLEGDMADVSPKEFTIPEHLDEEEVILRATNAVVGTREIQVRARGKGVQAEETLRLVVIAPPATRWSWSLLLVIGLWTSLLAVGLSLALVIAQNVYIGRAWLGTGEFTFLLAAGLVAGIIAGGFGQAFYGLFTQAKLIPQVGFLAGWLLLGGMLGRGLAFFIPNLHPWRATAAGCCGGFLGAAGFITLSFVGNLAGRFVGAAILGFALGLMVALVETAFRKVWLEVVQAPGDVRAVNLGGTPVFIGGDRNKCTVFVPGAPGKALKFWEQDGQVYCLNVVAEKTYPVSPGYRHPLKNVEVVVCSNEKSRKAFSASPQAQPIITLVEVPPAPRTATKSGPKPEAQQVPSDRCPVCGDRAKGLPGKRRCANCSTMF